MDAVDAGGGMTGELTILASTIGVAGTALGAFLKGRYGRKVKLRVSPTETEVEAGTPEEVERLLAIAQDYKKADASKRILNG